MNSFGRIFRIHIYGESHGAEVGIMVDGCPPGLEIDDKDFQSDLDRRRTGPAGTSARNECDRPVIRSGIFNGKTTGAPILIAFENNNQRPEDYNQQEIPRPGHADFAASFKYSNYNDPRGGGMFSGRLTTGLVAAGVIAKKIISPVACNAKLLEAGGSSNIEKSVKQAIEEKDSIGGVIECKVENIPAGWGEPFFDSLESVISHAVFSIPGIKGIEFGAGFAGAAMTGSAFNDPIIDEEGKTSSTHSGGIGGGISNGNDLHFIVAVRPASSISRLQESINLSTGKMEQFRIKGRHDVCFALRVPVIVEAMTAIVLADLKLVRRTNRADD